MVIVSRFRLTNKAIYLAANSAPIADAPQFRRNAKSAPERKREAG